MPIILAGVLQRANRRALRKAKYAYTIQTSNKQVSSGNYYLISLVSVYISRYGSSSITLCGCTSIYILECRKTHSSAISYK